MGNGVSHIVDVIEGSMEDVMFLEKVDVIISKWMGYFLVRESIFDYVICAHYLFFFLSQRESCIPVMHEYG